MQYNNIISIQGNELISAGAYRMVNGEKRLMSDVIVQNVLSDYAEGIMSATQEMVGCLDLQNEVGAVAKSTANGELLQVGDIVRIDSDDEGAPILTTSEGFPRIFRIKRRKFTYDGRPMLALTYQEIKR
jgi:hypothetical protein